MKGHIRRRGSGYAFVVELPRDPTTGKRRQKWHSGYRTKKAAEAALAKTLADLGTGTYQEPSRLSTAEYLRDWLRRHVDQHLAPNTRASYRTQVEKHLIPSLGHVPLATLNPLHIQDHYARMLLAGRRDGEGLAPASVLLQHTILSKALRQAVRWQLRTTNPIEGVTPPRKPRTRTGVFPAGTLPQLLAALEGEPSWFSVAVLLGAATGARRGEVLALRWEDVDLERGTIRITRSLAYTQAHGFTFGPPKTAAGLRPISIAGGSGGPSLLTLALRQHRGQQAQIRLFYGGEYRDHGLVVCQPDGGPWSPNYLTKRFGIFCTKHGFPGLTYHSLRHSYGTHLLRAGVPLRTVSELLGHADPGITLRVYAHVLEGDTDAAAARIDELLRGEG